VTGAGSARIVTGSVTLNADNVTPWLSETRGPRSLELLLIHEIGHVLGLAHVTDRAELMDARPIAVGGLGAGDRQGFAIAGNGSCHDDT
jgi:predicted Zn-dependent protease